MKKRKLSEKDLFRSCCRLMLRLFPRHLSLPQVTALYGASNDRFSNPRCCWHPSGLYAYSTSQTQRVIVWEIATGRVVQELEGEERVARGCGFVVVTSGQQCSVSVQRRRAVMKIRRSFENRTTKGRESSRARCNDMRERE